jgi:hypothetical protein
MNILNDDELPLWLHTTLSALLGLGLAMFPWIDGAPGLFRGYLEPLWFDGSYMFGNQTLVGTPARLAGLSLFFFGISLLLIPISQLRQLQRFGRWKYLPIILFSALGLALGSIVRS